MLTLRRVAVCKYCLALRLRHPECLQRHRTLATAAALQSRCGPTLPRAARAPCRLLQPKPLGFVADEILLRLQIADKRVKCPRRRLIGVHAMAAQRRGHDEVATCVRANIHNRQLQRIESCATHAAQNRMRDGQAVASEESEQVRDVRAPGWSVC